MQPYELPAWLWLKEGSERVRCFTNTYPTFVFTGKVSYVVLLVLVYSHAPNTILSLLTISLQDPQETFKLRARIEPLRRKPSVYTGRLSIPQAVINQRFLVPVLDFEGFYSTHRLRQCSTMLLAVD